MRNGTLSLLLLAGAVQLGCSSTYKAADLTGIRTRSVVATDTDKHGYAPGSGVIVSSIDPETEAYRKGIREGDFIKAVNGSAVASPNDFADAVIAAPTGSNVNIQYANAQKKDNQAAVKKPEESKKKVIFGISVPFLVYREGGDTSGTALLHINGIRIRNKEGEKGFMLLELLGWVKKKDGWGVRILFLHFGSASIKPEKGHSPDI